MMRNISGTFSDLCEIYALTQDNYIELDLLILQALQMIIEKSDVEPILSKIEENEFMYGSIVKEQHDIDNFQKKNDSIMLNS